MFVIARSVSAQSHQELGRLALGTYSMEQKANRKGSIMLPEHVGMVQVEAAQPDLCSAGNISTLCFNSWEHNCWQMLSDHELQLACL